MVIIVAALRRSGTTVFWRTLRQDQRLCCFDEPFNPLLRELPAEHPKRIRAEFIELYHRDPIAFRRMFAPILPAEELAVGMSRAQRRYLQFLIQSHEHVAFDTVRCTTKIRTLYEVAPAAVLVHLYREPRAFVSSHLLPNAEHSSWRRRLTNVCRRASFFFRTRYYNHWQYEEIIDQVGIESFDSVLERVDLAPAAVRALPACGKMLALWRASFSVIEEDGRALFGDRFVSVKFEDFCDHPQEHVERIYAAASLSCPKLDYSHIKPARVGYRLDDRRWQVICQAVGIDLCSSP